MIDIQAAAIADRANENEPRDYNRQILQKRKGTVSVRDEQYVRLVQGNLSKLPFGLETPE